MCAADRLHSGFRKAEMLDLPFLDQFLDCPRHVFDGDVRVHAVLIEQINDIGLQPLQRGFRHLFDVFRSALQLTPPRFAASSRFEPELSGDHHLLTNGRKSFAHEFFIGKRAIHFGGIEEGDAMFDRRSKKRDHLLRVREWRVRKAHSHAAESEG